MPKLPVKSQPGVKYGELKKAAKNNNMKLNCDHPNYMYIEGNMHCSQCKVLISDNAEECKTIETMYNLNPQMAYMIINNKLNNQT